MNIIIKSAVIIDSKSKHHHHKKDVLIEKGIITKIASTIKNENNYKELDLKNLHISNGWFDSSVSFGEPGYEERETLEKGLLTAAKSGFTSVAVNPNTFPKIDNKSAVEFLINKASGNIVDL